MNASVSGIEPGQRHLNGLQTSGRELRNLTKPTFDIVESFDEKVATRDGTILMADVYRPDADEKFPALVAFSSYPRQIQNTRAPMGMVEAGASDFFVPRGYVHIIANARGTSGSEGTWGLLDAQERDDIYDLIEWAASQPWCDGNVGMLGISYFAMAQIAASVAKPPSLKAIFPIGTNESVYDVAWHHGLHAKSFISAWLPAVGVLAQKSDDLWRGSVLEVLSKVLSKPAVHRRLANVNGEAMAVALKKFIRSAPPEEPYGRLWQQAAIEHPAYDEFWAERDSRPGLANVDIPVYLGCDWDNVVMHLPGTFTSWRALQHNSNVRMAMLPSGGENWPWESMHLEALGWYDHWLKGIDTGVMDGPPIRYYIPVADEWRTAEAWPPPESELVEYALASDGTLNEEKGALDPGSRTYLRLAPDSGRPDRGGPPTAPDRLVWDTLVLTNDVDMCGNIELRLDATITDLDTAWIGIIYDVDEDGDETAVTGGWLRAMLRQVDEHLSVPGAPVVPCKEPIAIPVGEVVTYRIPVVPSARRFKAGHKIRLVLTSDDNADKAPRILDFIHTAIGGSSVNIVHASSRLLLPILPVQLQHP